MKNKQEFYNQLEDKIIASYQEGVTIEDAEKLAAEFLTAQLQVSNDLKRADLDSRMRKSGLKAIKAAAYLDAVGKAEKKPTEGQLEHSINLDPSVNKEQDELDNAEVERDNLNRYYSVFREAHVYYRGIAKGNFNG